MPYFWKYFVFVFAITCMFTGYGFSAQHGGKLNSEAEHVVAEVHGKKITVKDIRDFATNSPTYYAYLELPGGPNKILGEMILRELLYLEGHDMKIPEDSEKSRELYVRKVLDKLFPEEPELDEKDLRKFYEKHPELFSTPKFIRVSVIRVYVKRENEQDALKKIKEAKSLLEEGMPFEQVAAEYSEDALSRDRKGDLGFLPDNEIKPLSLKKLLMSMKKGQVSDIQRVDGYYGIFKVTDIREPVLEPFNEKFVREKAEKYLAKEALEKIRERLTWKWGVRYLDPAFAPEN